MSFFNDLNDKLANFMVGRNGSDKLGRWCLGAAIVTILISLFVPSIILTTISYIMLFYSIYRMFSKNVAARCAENERFESFLDRFHFKKKNSSSSHGGTSYQKANTSSAKDQPKKKAQNPTKMTIKCEKCGQSLSVPKGRGTLKVTCPKCNHQMKIKS